MKYLFLLLFFSACAIEEVERQPLLASPLGLNVQVVSRTSPPPAVPEGIAMYFTANNNEIYFTGFSLYISTRKEDFQCYDGTFFAIKPTLVPGSQARLLTNYTFANEKNLSISVNGAMAFPELYLYPPDATFTAGTRIFATTTFTELPPLPDGTGGGPFVPGTTYYFVAFSYSTVDNVYSLPSNIEQITYP